MKPLLRAVRPDDFAFAFSAKSDAMRAHIEAHWGWDEAFQLSHHQKRWKEKPWQIIVFDEQAIGTVSIDFLPSHLQFGEFYLLKAFRSQGIGSQILAETLKIADAKRLETRLEYLKWNPVASLYARHGFGIVAENEIHYFLLRPPHEA